jgi:transcriptional regulator with XRE-family HTH domain
MKPAYSKWLTQKMYEWGKSNLEQFKITNFARYLEVSQPSLSQWLRGDHPPTGENLKIIAEKLGDEIYFLVGRLPPKLENFIQNNPPEEVTKLLKQITHTFTQTK